MSLVQSKSIHNADYRHAQSLGRQRKHATASPCEQAAAIAKVVRKCIADQQSLPDLDRYGLTDAVWTELMSTLDADALTMVADACDGDVPFTPEPPSPQHTAQVAHDWHHAFPVHTHSLSWTGSDGISHSHTVRSDDIDDVLRQVKTIKVVIAAAKTKAQAQAVDTKEPGSISPRRCAIHEAEMTRRVSAIPGRHLST